MCNRERFHRALSSHSQPLWKEVDIFEETTTELSTKLYLSPCVKIWGSSKQNFLLPSSVAVLGLKFISFTVLSLLPVAIRSPLH